jgi:hypothetical protein
MLPECREKHAAKLVHSLVDRSRAIRAGPMDAITLAVLDEWFAQHKTECGVHRFDVMVDRYDAAHTRVDLVCPTCRGIISGTIAGIEMPAIAQLLLGPVSQN